VSKTPGRIFRGVRLRKKNRREENVKAGDY
jgi:hypothetical protein